LFEPRDAVVFVDDNVAGLEVHEDCAVRHAPTRALRVAWLAEPEELRVGEHA
jgi:hypothetical protein